MVELLFKPRIKTLYPAFESFEQDHLLQLARSYFCSTVMASRQTPYVPSSSSLPSMKSPKPKRISYVKAGAVIVDQVKPAILKGTAVRFDLSKG